MFSIRNAGPEDSALILSLIKELAVYEKMQDEVVATVETIFDALFIKKAAHAVIAFEDEIPTGFALYFFNFSTFLGKPGLYLEDLYILPEHRAKGYGKKLLLHLAGIALEKQCGRMEWSVLDWNTPAIDFYKSLGAMAMEEWTVFRLDEKAMRSL